MRFLLLLLIPALSFAQNGLVTIKLKGGGTGGAFWSLNGNSIVDSNFIGTINSKDLVFKTKNTEAMRIDTNGNVGIGTATPAYNFDVVGGLKTFKFYGTLAGPKYAIYSLDDDMDGFLYSILDSTNSGNPLSSVYYVKASSWSGGGNDTTGSLFSFNFGIQNNIINDVAIGTSNPPTAKLHVNGTTRLEGTPQSTTSDSLLTIDGQGNVAWRTPYYYGTDTLTNGVDTVWTSDVTANSNIQLTSNGLNGSTQSGHLDVTIISAGNYFVVNSLKSNTTVETGDQRKYYWFFIRKP